MNINTTEALPRFLRVFKRLIVLLIVLGLFVSSGWYSLKLFEGLASTDTSLSELQPCTPRPGLSPEMVIIPGGDFLMGSPENESERFSNERQHEVSIKAFAIGRCEVAFAEYDAFAQATGREQPDDWGWGRDRRPVINVDWNDAVAYAQWLSRQTGETYRLPTEAEWEYATRAQSMTAFWWGDSITTDQANYNGNFSYNNSPKGEYRGKTLEVGSFESNPFGLFDVHGNVWEWTCSVFDEEYGGGEQRCAEADEEGRRVLRGGSWDFGPRRVRSAYRDNGEATVRDVVVGFRLARVVP